MQLEEIVEKDRCHGVLKLADPLKVTAAILVFSNIIPMSII